MLAKTVHTTPAPRLGNIREARSIVKAVMQEHGYPETWSEALVGYLAMSFDRLADRCSSLCQPDPSPTQSGVMHTFSKFALPMNWDFIEGVTISGASGGFSGASEWVAKAVEQGGSLNIPSFPHLPNFSLEDER